jgi:hypothetical protein
MGATRGLLWAIVVVLVISATLIGQCNVQKNAVRVKLGNDHGGIWNDPSLQCQSQRQLLTPEHFGVVHFSILGNLNSSSPVLLHIFLKGAIKAGVLQVCICLSSIVFAAAASDPRKRAGS